MSGNVLGVQKREKRLWWGRNTTTSTSTLWEAQKNSNCRQRSMEAEHTLLDFTLKHSSWFEIGGPSPGWHGSSCTSLLTKHNNFTRKTLFFGVEENCRQQSRSREPKNIISIFGLNEAKPTFQQYAFKSACTQSVGCLLSHLVYSVPQSDIENMSSAPHI